MEKARLLFLIFIYSMLTMACSTEPEIPSGGNTNNEVSNENGNGSSNQEQDEENTNNDNQNNNEENMSNSTIKISVNGTTLTKSAQRRASNHKYE